MIKSPSFVLRKVCEIREQAKGYRYCARTVLCRVICAKGISQLPDRKRTCQFHKYPVDTLAPSICAFVGFGIKVSAYRFWICEQGLYRVQALGHYRTGARVERAKQVAILRAQNASQGLARAGVIRFDKVQFNQYRYHCTIYGNSVRFLASAEGARGRQSKREAREIHTGEEEKKEGLFASSVSGRFRRHCLDSQSTTVVKQQRGSRASGVQSDRGKHRGAPVGNSGEVPALSCLSYPTARERVEASSKQASSLHFSLLLPKFICHTPFEEIQGGKKKRHPSNIGNSRLTAARLGEASMLSFFLSFFFFLFPPPFSPFPSTVLIPVPVNYSTALEHYCVIPLGGKVP